MDACIDRGLMQDGTLPGGLKVRRRARSLAERIAEKRRRNTGAATEAMDHASLWAIAVNEENAAGGRDRQTSWLQPGGSNQQGIESE